MVIVPVVVSAGWSFVVVLRPHHTQGQPTLLEPQAVNRKAAAFRTHRTHGSVGVQGVGSF